LGARSMLLSGLKKDFERRGEVRNREGEEEFMKGLEIVWEKLDLGDMRSVMAFNGKVLETYAPYFPSFSFRSLPGIDIVVSQRA
jgi:hypothetical protein